MVVLVIALVIVAYSVRERLSSSTESDPAQREAPDQGGQGGATGAVDGGETSDEGVIAVEDVWLLDLGGGEFEWGALLSSTSQSRSDLVVSMAAYNGDDEVVVDSVVVLEQLGESQSAVIGEPFESDRSPVRIEVMTTLGSADPDLEVPQPSVDSVTRVPSGQVDVDDRLVGTVSIASGGVDTTDLDVNQSVSIAALWRDELGEVIATAYGVARTRSADEEGRVEGAFSISLRREIVPQGEPDQLIASIIAAS